MHIPPFLYWIVSGALFSLSFLSPWTAFFVIPAFILLLFAIDKENSKIKLFVNGAIMGSIYFLGPLFWIWSTFPIRWLSDVAAPTQFLFIGSYWILSCIVLGISFGLFALTVKPLLLVKKYALLGVPFIFILLELFRSLLLSLYVLGPSSDVNIKFSFGYLGYVFSSHPFLLQLAVWGGVYALSFGGALLLTGVYFYVDTKLYTQKLVTGILGCLVLVLLIGPVFFKNDVAPLGLKVVAVQTQFDAELLSTNEGKWIKNERLKEAVLAALRTEPDAVILPEDSNFTEAVGGIKEVQGWTEKNIGKSTSKIIDTGQITDERGIIVLRAHMYDLSTAQVYIIDKQYLVPQGEYLSFFHKKILSLFLPREKVNDIDDSLYYHMGLSRDTTSVPKDFPSVLFCFESIVPFGVKAAIEVRKPSFVAHPVSHAWFKDPDTLWYQFDAMLKVQAMWGRVPVVSASNMAESKVYLPSGTIHYGEEIASGELWKLKLFSL